MKEMITIEIGNPKNNEVPMSKALTVMPNAQKETGLKLFITKFLTLLGFKQSVENPRIVQIGTAVKKYRFGLAVVGLVFMLIFNNDDSKAIGLNNKNNEKTTLSAGLDKGINEGKDETTDRKNSISENKEEIKPLEMEPINADDVKSYYVPNIPNVESRKKTLSDLSKNTDKAIKGYISKYLKTAREEAKKQKIPTSILLGLALMNSNYGLSKTAIATNNHFDIKCSENSIPMGKGMKGQFVTNDQCFTEYKAVWSSYRAQGNLIAKLMKKNKTKMSNPQDVVITLENSGYFNNRNFSAEQLIDCINENDLTKHD
jgi:flagellum-specific peptidoglycan hydrolase FlgJ